MNPKLQNIILVVLMIVVIAGGAVIFFQQRSIKALNREIFPQPSSSDISSLAAPPVADPLAKLAPPLADQIKNDLVKNTKIIVGTVQGKEANRLTVEAEVVDLPNIIRAETSDYQNLPKIKKAYNVEVNEKTEFKNKRFDEIQAGDSVAVATEDLVYQTDKFGASSVESMIK